MNEQRDDGAPVVFEDLDAIYVADACVPLERAAAAGEVTLRALARGHYPGDPFPEGAVPEIRTLGYWDAPAPQSWGLDWHRNEGIEITYLAHGSTSFSVGENDWELQAGALTITRPWQEHRVGAPNVGASQLHWLILDVGVRRPTQTWVWPDWVALDPGDLARLTRLLQHNEYAVWTGNAALARAFEHAAALIRDPSSPTFASEARIVLSSILLEVLKSLESSDVVLDAGLTAPRRGVAVFLDQLDGQLDRPWTVATMARACGMGRTRFALHCQDLTNSSPMVYLNGRRLGRAADLLVGTSDTVTDIAIACGFETPQYFATRFKREYGVTPTAFRAGERSRSTAGRS